MFYNHMQIRDLCIKVRFLELRARTAVQQVNDQRKTCYVQ